MAKWGESDPRWLVADTNNTNPGSWHWEERNLLKWSQQRLAELVAGFGEHPVNGGSGSVALEELKECTGEAYLTRRKGNKKFAAFELQLKIRWRGTWAPGGGPVKGLLTVTEFASFHDDDEVQYDVSTDEGAGEPGAGELQASVRQLQRAVYDGVLGRYVRELNAQELTARAPSSAPLEQQQQGEQQQGEQEQDEQEQGEQQQGEQVQGEQPAAGQGEAHEEQQRQRDG